MLKGSLWGGYCAHGCGSKSFVLDLRSYGVTCLQMPPPYSLASSWWTNEMAVDFFKGNECRSPITRLAHQWLQKNINQTSSRSRSTLSANLTHQTVVLLCSTYMYMQVQCKCACRYMYMGLIASKRHFLSLYYCTLYMHCILASYYSMARDKSRAACWQFSTW